MVIKIITMPGEGVCPLMKKSIQPEIETLLLLDSDLEPMVAILTFTLKFNIQLTHTDFFKRILSS